MLVLFGEPSHSRQRIKKRNDPVSSGPKHSSEAATIESAERLRHV